MKTCCQKPNWFDRLPPRSGVTLIEVVVSMMILSIGIGLLTTLLPISILRTAQATQLTHAVILRNNAEAFIESSPAILNNSQIAISMTNPSALAVVDPLGSQLVTPTQPFGGTSNILRTNGGATTLVQANQLAQSNDTWTTVVEGQVSPNLGATPPNLQFTQTSGALGVLSTLQFQNSVSPSSPPHRIIVTDTTKRSAAILPLRNVNVTLADSMTWIDPNGSGPVFPGSFIPTFARIETQQRKFSWMMTVRKRLLSTPDGSAANNTWAAEIDVAVFFNRSFTVADETTFTVAPVVDGFDGKPGVAGVDDDGANGVDDNFERNWLGSDDNRTVVVTLPTGTGAVRPYLKKGGYMLEPTQLRWYRIVNMTEVNSSSTSATLLLDRDIRTANSNTAIANGIFMKGIVEVYPLGSRTGVQ